MVAVVVTFDRLDMLRRQLDRLHEVVAGGELHEVLVVDNASSDGTGAWLREQAATHPHLHATTLAVNSGGAGGFNHGLAWAVDHGADLVWLMDDDGLPEPDCLTLLLQRDDLDFWGPAVVAAQEPSRLCFPIRLPGGTRVVHDLASVEAAAVDGLIRDVVIPFNGVLVTRELVARIGYPLAAYFIWGDDVEYLWRAQQAGARIATVVDARVLHPATDDLGTPMMGGRTTYNHSPSDLKHYCMARNNTVNLRRYRGWPHVLMFWVKTLWFYTLTKPTRGRLRTSARAAWAGLRGDFTGHRRYLR
ncbi:glycosyltransferase family 2 protein [Nocardioides flavescens]